MFKFCTWNLRVRYNVFYFSGTEQAVGMVSASSVTGKKNKKSKKPATTKSASNTSSHPEETSEFAIFNRTRTSPTCIYKLEDIKLRSSRL